MNGSLRAGAASRTISPLSMLAPAAGGAPRTETPPTRRSGAGRGAAKREAIWQWEPGNRFNSFIVARNGLLAAGQTGPEDKPEAFLAAVLMEGGSKLWQRPLPATVVQAAGFAATRPAQPERQAQPRHNTRGMSTRFIPRLPEVCEGSAGGTAAGDVDAAEEEAGLVK